MNLPFKTVQDLVLELGKSHFNGFNALPYNRFSDSGIASSERWWLCPTKDKLGFAYGKIVATTREDWVEPGKVFVGFNVEKGILDKGIKGDGYVLKKTWLWHEFVRDAGSRLGPKIVEASDALGSPLQVVIGCGTEPQWGGQYEQGDVVRFTSRGPSLSLIEAPPAMKYLGDVAKCRSCTELAAALQKLNGTAFGYQWVDLMIGSHFTMDAGGTNDLATAATMLEPFRGWLRSGM
jgi:hypothetical protein